MHQVELSYKYKERRAKLYVCEDCGQTTENPEEHLLHLQNFHPNSPALKRSYDRRIIKIPKDSSLLINCSTSSSSSSIGGGGGANSLTPSMNGVLNNQSADSTFIQKTFKTEHQENDDDDNDYDIKNDNKNYSINSAQSPDNNSNLNDDDFNEDDNENN